MDVNSIIRDVVMLVLLPLTAIVVRALASYLKSKTNNATVQKYVDMAQATVNQAVEYVAQTYVDALKKAGTFTEDAQKQAFNEAKSKALDILGAETVELLNAVYGDFNAWLETAIEQRCRELKA